MTAYLPNTFPMPEGPGWSFSQLSGSGTTANFTVQEPGLYMVAYMCAELALNGDPNWGLNNPGTLLLQTVVAGVTSTALTFLIPGVQNIDVGPLGTVFNFNYSFPGAKMVWMSKGRYRV